jgi:phosphate-selective porin OprO/OprP
MRLSKRLAAVLLSGTSLLAVPGAAHADAISDRLAALQAQIDDLGNTVADLKRAQSAQYSDVQKQRAGDIQFSFKNGRFTAKSSDGEFAISTRALVQFDAAYYGQGTVPAGVDFASGTNFRRARAGISGVLFKDWSFEFIYDFGGSGIEASTISSAYIQYDGLGPVHIKVGAYPAPESFEDSTSASDLLFLERSQPADLARSVAGSDGRNAATIFAYDDNYFAAVSYTGALVGDAATFDEQQTIVARGAYRLVGSDSVNFAVGADTTYAIKLPDLLAGPASPHALQLRERPELNVDSQNKRLIDTGVIDASHYWQWGLEATGNYHSLYAQGGYFHYDVTRRASLLADPDFDGWYVQGSWVITGESKPWKAERGAYGLPSPDQPLGHGGAGAWEVAARYSTLDLNFHEGAPLTPTPADGIRGGEQHIWTVGLNWYPNSAIRFQLDFQHTNVDRLDALGGSTLDAKLNAISLRTQISL